MYHQLKPRLYPYPIDYTVESEVTTDVLVLGGGIAGCWAAIAAKRHFPKAKLRLFDDEPSAVQELRNGRVHAMVSAQPLPAHTAVDYPETLVSYDAVLMQEAIGFGVRKGDPDTLNFFNNWIEIVRNKGWIQERHKYWFLSKDWKGLIE